MERETYRVFLGRFAPVHIGHEMVFDDMIEKHGIKNSLAIIGSSTSYTDRTPYKFEERKNMIETLYPGIKILPLPDIKPGLKYFDGSTNDIWLKNIAKIQDEMDADFIFVGGCAKDLEVLAVKFKTEIMINRKTEGLDMSGTKVREALQSGNISLVAKMVDPRILDQVVAGYKKYHEQRN